MIPGGDAPQFAPGWYPDGLHMRWWDGSQWGPFAPTPDGPIPGGPLGRPGYGGPGYGQSEVERGKTLALLSHLGFALGGFILPLVLYLVEQGKPDRNRFVCHHASEALNFMITTMGIWIAAMGALFVSMFASIPSAGSTTDSAPWAVFVMFPLMFLLMGASWVFGIIGAWKANNGEWWRYPINLRLVGRGIDWQNA